ncbi:MAG: glycosyltransferase [Actinobacteria bacterium]|nr:glycosyltransferase [Actinomycetota bacterium]
MLRTSLPFISIITVNFNGKFFLKSLFDSIKKLNYPQGKLQVIMVDNGSKDDSVTFVRKNYKFVEILLSDKNLGFAGGNNAGVKLAKGEYIAFINNDCMVYPDWLISMVNLLQQKEKENIKAGGVGSKVLFYFKYLPLKIVFENSNELNKDLNKDFNNDENEINTSDFSGIVRQIIIRENTSENKIKNESSEVFKNNEIKNNEMQNLINFANKSFKYLNGFYDIRKDSDGKLIRKIRKEALVGVPVIDKNKDIILEIEFSFLKDGTCFKLFIEDEEIVSVNNISNNNNDFKINYNNNLYSHSQGNGLKYRTILIKIPKEKFKCSKDIINSCGSMINKSFYAKEIGYESFNEQFEKNLNKNKDEKLKNIEFKNVKSFEVFALPGSSFIVKKELINEIGLFDEKFFTYYEDIDFFWRARLNGWRFFVEPESVVRHFHCGSGEEWSYSFTYNVLRNRLLMIYKCGWPMAFLKNYLSFCTSAFINLVYFIIAKIKRKKLDRIDIKIRIRIFFEFFVLMIFYLVKRIKIRITAKISDLEIKKWQTDF